MCSERAVIAGEELEFAMHTVHKCIDVSVVCGHLDSRQLTQSTSHRPLPRCWGAFPHEGRHVAHNATEIEEKTYPWKLCRRVVSWSALFFLFLCVLR